MIFNNLQNFESESDAISQAEKDLLSILNSKTYLVPDKFSSLLSDYRKRQDDYNNEISVSIKNQIENVSLSVEFISESSKNLDKCKEEFANMNEFWETELEFHKDMDIYEKILIFRKNLSNLLDQIKYFLTISSQIKKLEELFQESEENYDYIHFKLLALCELRDNVISKMTENKEKTEDLKKIFKEFEILDSFESRFYTKLFDFVKNARILAKKNPMQLIKVIKIFEDGDQMLENEGKKGGKFKDKCLEVIKKSIDERFDEELKGAKDVNGMLERFKFTVEDLIDVLDNGTKCFPKKYEIFKLYEECYKNNIEKRIVPFLDNEEEIKKSYGALISLLIWMDSYETVLIRAGINLEESEYVVLRSRVKSYMPFFLDHVKQLLADYCERATIKDRTDKQKLEKIAEIIKEKKELLSNFAEDIFHFVNQQLELLVGKLTGELYIELIRIITDQINYIQDMEKQNLKNSLDNPSMNQNEGISPMFKIVLFINNYWKCLQYTNETKQYCIKFGSENQIERIDKIFMNDLSKGLLSSINDFFHMLLPYIFNEIDIHIISNLFSQKWLVEDLLESAILTLEDYYKDLKSTIMSPIYFNKIVKLSLEHLLILYFDQFLYANKIAFNSNVDFVSEYIIKIIDQKIKIDNNDQNGDEKKKKKKEKEKEKEKEKQKNILQQSFIIVFSNKEVFVEKLKKEKNYIIDKCNESFLNIVGKSAIDKIDRTFKLFIDLLKINKVDFESLFGPTFELFQKKGVYIIESVLYIREDVDAVFKKDALKRYDDIISKLNNKN